MAWQDSLAWVRAQDPRWFVGLFLALMALWLARRLQRFWRGRDDLMLVMAFMALAFPLGALLLARSRHGDARSRRVFFVLAGVSAPLYLVPLQYAVHPLVTGVATVLWGGTLTVLFGLLQRPDRVESPRIEPRLYALGLHTLHHLVSADGRHALAVDTTNQTVVLANVEHAFPHRVSYGNIKSVDVFAGDKPIDLVEGVVKGPIALRIITTDLTDPEFLLLLANPGRLGARERARVQKDAFAWRNLLRKLRTRAAGSQLPLYLRELHTAGVINDTEYRSLLDRAARI